MYSSAGGDTSGGGEVISFAAYTSKKPRDRLGQCISTIHSGTSALEEVLTLQNLIKV